MEITHDALQNRSVFPRLVQYGTVLVADGVNVDGTDVLDPARISALRY